jgi:antirestriction protein
MNTEKLEKLKKSLDNKFIPDNVKDKIRNEIEKLESEIKSEEMSASAIKKEVAKVEDKVEVAVDKAEKKAESTEPKKGRGRPRKTPATTSVEPKATETAIKKTAMVVAKTIRKDGEKWNDAMKRANGVMKKEKVEVKKTTKSELDRLLARVRKNKSLMSDLKGVKDLGRDAVRQAKPVGKRISESGNVYYEYRANKTDRKTYGKYAFAGGGAIKIEKGIYRVGKPIKIGNMYEQKIAIVSDNGKVTTNNDYAMTISGLTSQKHPMITEKQFYSLNYELGGSVVTDLAGHTGGSLGTGNKGMLDGFSNTAYTGLVGETGAMSSGEMFIAGGNIQRPLYILHDSETKDTEPFKNLRTLKEFEQKANELGYTTSIDRKMGWIAIAKTPTGDDILIAQTLNPSKGMFMNGGGLPAGAEQSYVNYYLGEGASAGIFKDGGAIPNNYEGKTNEQIWNLWSEEQKSHFLYDHLMYGNPKVLDANGGIKRLIKLKFKELPLIVQMELNFHRKEGQYARGGGVRKVGNREYSYGRNWTNDHEHVNQSEEHEVNYTRKGKFLGVFSRGGLTGESARVKFLREEFASEDLIDELKEKLNLKSDDLKNQDVIAFAYTNYGGSIIDKYAIEYFLENYPKNIVVEETSYNGKNAFVFGKPAKEWMEQSDDYILGFDDFESYYNEKENEDFMEGINFFIQDLKRNYTFNEEEVRDSLEEEFTGYFNVDTSGLDYNEQKMIDYLNKEGLIKEEEFAKGGGVRQVGNREYSTGRNWTNDHRHTNKSEEHEVNYNRKRFFAGGGGLDDDTPKIYVADLEAYNNGRLSGVWLDLTDYSDADELMDAINNFLKTTGGEEYAVHDYENLPRSMYSEYMGVRDFEEIYEMLDLAKENDLPLDVVMEVVSQFDRSALDEYTGVYDSEQDFAEQLVDDIGITSFIDFRYYLEISETDRRLLAQEEADYYADAIRDEDGGNRLIEEADLDVEEYEEADSERQEEMLDEAREIVYDRIYDRTYDALDDPYSYFVEELGSYDDESFANANFVRVDYEKLADALEQDYTFIRHDGQIYVFNIR